MLTASARARGTLLKRGKWRQGVKALLCLKKSCSACGRGDKQLRTHACALHPATGVGRNLQVGFQQYVSS